MIPKKLQKKEIGFCLIQPKSKDPSGFGNGWQKRPYHYNDKTLIKHLETGGNYGVIGGYGNIIILDADNKELADKWFKELDTFTVQTCGGTYHFYFICKDKVENKVLVEDKGEIRAKGYMVVGPNCYAIDEKKGHEGWYKVIKDKEIKEISLTELEAIVKPYLRSEVKEVVNSDVIDNKQKDTSRSGREMFEVVKLIGKGLSKEEVFREMMAFAKWSNSPKQYKELTYSKAKKHIESNKEDDSIQYVSVPEILHNDMPKPRWRIKDIIPESGVSYIASPPGEGKTMIMLHAAQCISAGKDFLGKTVIPGKIIYLDGENGEICAYNRLKRIAEGNDFTDEELKNFHYSIFPYIRFDPKHSSFKTFKKFFEEFNPDVIFFDSLVRFMEGSENDAEACKLVFDTLRSLLKAKPSLTIVILHHVSKNNNGGMNALRGSSEIAAAASSIVMLRRLNYAYELKIEKSRYLDMAKGCKIYYKINDVENGLSFETTDEQNIPSNSVGRAGVDFWEWVNENKIQTFASKDCETKLKTMGHSKSAVFRLIGDLLKDQYIMKIKRGYYNIIDNPISTEEEVKDD